MKKFNLRQGVSPQHYGLGVKEVWEILPENHRAGTVTHTVGWPLDLMSYGGGFIYHMEPNLLHIGMVVGLDYSNPYLSPYQEFQRFKTHPRIKALLEGGTCISYGARCLNEGGLQAVPKLTFPGGMLAGCSAGFLNVPKIKGSHTAMKTGTLAGECAADAVLGGFEGSEVTKYEEAVRSSWVWEELSRVRNFKPAWSLGMIPGLGYGGMTLMLSREYTKPAKECEKIEYPKPDGVYSFDLLENLARSGVNHEHDQPAHLKVKEESQNYGWKGKEREKQSRSAMFCGLFNIFQPVLGTPSDSKGVSLPTYDGPEGRFCPAKVYEYVPDEDAADGRMKLQINAQNCVHCKCCSIKTPQDTFNGCNATGESYLGLPGGLGVIIDKEVEAYERGLKQRAKAPGNLMELGARRSYPASFSWLYERPECLDYVHHQGTCGACYMFAALDSLSDRHCIDETKASTLGKIDHLSIQMALLCEPLGRQCSGGWADVGFNYSKYYGLVTSTDWPYERSCLSDSECQFGKQCFSPSSYACPGFFTQEELNEVVTFSDALRVTKRRCDNSNLVDPDNCKVWAEMMFAFSPTMVFMPESCFCDELEADWAKFAVRQSQVSHHGDGSGMTVLLQEQLREDEEGFNFFTWLYNLFTGGPHEENTTKTEAQTGSKDTWNSDIPGGQWGSEEKKTSTVTTETPSISTADQCNRDRCLTEPQVHKSTEYHYVLNHKDAFKEEILKDGPLYTSFFCLRGLHLVLHVLARAGLQLPMGRYAGWPCCGAHWLGERLHLPRGAFLRVMGSLQ
eukprot:s1993_g3.t1